ncbi:MAG: HDOD domain-containing protein [Planctomycetota bacterium]|nr:HDOD domain-containing protein [Planctomycetota bacterium]
MNSKVDERGLTGGGSAVRAAGGSQGATTDASSGHSGDSQLARRIELVLDQMDTLPTLSPIATRLLSIGADENMDMNQVVRLIESDPALASRIVGLCRKADKGLGDKITTVRRAVVMLGMETVRSAVLSVSIYDTMKRREHDLDRKLAKQDPSVAALRNLVFDRVGFWKHAVAVACASELLAKRIRSLRVSPDEAFLCGLLHDLGKIGLDLVLPQAYARVLEIAERKHLEAAVAERMVVGLDHHTAGRRLAEHWFLPPRVQDVIWLHSQPYASIPNLGHKPLIGLVTLGKAICRQLYLGWSGDFGPIPDSRRIAVEMNVDPKDADAIHAPLHEAIIERFTLLGLEESTGPELLLQSIAAANRQLSRVADRYQARAEEAQRFQRSLMLISDFHADPAAGGTLVNAAGAVVRSLANVTGKGPYALASADAEGNWSFMRFTPSGVVESEQPIDLPEEREPAWQALRQLPEVVGGSGTVILSWLEQATSVKGLRLMSLLPLMPPRSTSRGSDWLGLLLYSPNTSTDHELLQPRGAVASTWAVALAAAAGRDAARRLGERLAESNRTLVSMQTKLTESESLARLGEMTAGAAHEMNNPLTIIKGRSQLLSQALKDASTRAAAAAISQAAHELSDLITTLNVVAQTPSVSMGVTTPGRIVGRVRELAEARVGLLDNLLLCDAAADREIVTDPELAAMALAELVINAREAAPDDSPRIHAAFDASDSLVEFVVEDKGPGLSAKAQRHAFDPFFSEKPAGRQRGLGLTKARRIAEALEGAISLRPGIKGGTRASLTLPVKLASSRAAA